MPSLLAIIMIIAMIDNNYIQRTLDLDKLLKERTVLLFGPRQTGKSAYIRNQLQEKPAASYSLLDQRLQTLN